MHKIIQGVDCQEATNCDKEDTKLEVAASSQMEPQTQELSEGLEKFKKDVEKVMQRFEATMDKTMNEARNGMRADLAAAMKELKEHDVVREMEVKSVVEKTARFQEKVDMFTAEPEVEGFGVLREAFEAMQEELDAVQAEIATHNESFSAQCRELQVNLASLDGRLANLYSEGVCGFLLSTLTGHS